jgi:hypothetical protein
MVLYVLIGKLLWILCMAHMSFKDFYWFVMDLTLDYNIYV